MMRNNVWNGIQLQPVSDNREEWNRLADLEDLRFEVLELSTPPALNESGRFRSCMEWYRETGKVTSVHGPFIDINPASGDDTLRNMARGRCSASCDLALELGAGSIVFHSSCFSFLRGDYLDSWAKDCATFYEELAKAYDLHIFIENSQDLDPTPLRKLMDLISDERIGVCLDLGHANYSRATIEEWFSALGERIGYLHLSDNEGSFDDHLPLGMGSIDWEQADRCWRALGRAMPITLEVGGLEGVRHSLAFLKEHRLFGLRQP